MPLPPPPEKHLGFVVEAFLDLMGWKSIPLPPLEPLLITSCPCCSQELKTLASIVSQTNPEKLRLGCCPRCGYVGYKDKPLSEWVSHFYTTSWDEEGKNKKINLKPPPRNPSQILYLSQKLGLDRKANILEIGSGYGRLLDEFRQAGFANVIGIEPSLHRARLARQERGVNIIEGDFTHPEVIAHLSKQVPFQLIFSVHVLEHTYNPSQILAAATHLQDEGGYIILSLPCFTSEPTMDILFFLPHLHSFTLTAITHLLRRHGYRLLDSSLSTRREIVIVATKNAAVSAYGRSPEGRKVSGELPGKYFETALSKFTTELALKKYPDKKKRMLWWLKKDASRSGQLTYPRHPVAQKISFAYQSLFHPLRQARALIVSNLRERLTDARLSPLEIQFPSSTHLFYK